MPIRGKILVAHGTIKRLVQNTGYSDNTIRSALRDDDCGRPEIRLLIRTRALECFGGVIQPRHPR